MADTMQFDLVSPERNLVSVPVREVRLPGAEGDLTAMPGHAPAIVNLRPGLVTVVAADGTSTEFAVTGGFAEINNDSVSLLAERGHPRAEMTQEVFNEMMAQAHRRVKQAQERSSTGEDIVTAAVKLLADMEALGTHIGLDPNQANFPH
ncbi:ATP synthase F1 subunit epsilon [Paracoccus yeei]|jgi:F-type H+-transporting ATPase subunit epsilon|uniref:ATP synthase epsilon chain n=2 Tax=Paracoccus TaxID=265 RepID=A0A1V0GQ50_9RHOB|nr:MULTISPECIES: F0F1 ATP synthase subunit epsilon [Paracoccus]ARC35973.1 ATP synthase F1 subunit epsilon [Paracoccus yeei]ATQ54522.1 ATP synthase F1 subunit epsilon [Paracoccus yeei]AWX92634.1 F0F1 ATP synthase subunit epsilon [Paracoccus mutanolyticus]AYF01876.1 ATP synthase F1 subunit epsilon [Paracoccus yeei]MBY0137468.1 F0F1 ATP synthase subunit epsilon [Paracoccus yeei]